MDKKPLSDRELEIYCENFTGLESEDENEIFDDSLNDLPYEPASDDDNEDQKDCGTTSEPLDDISAKITTKSETKNKQITSTIGSKKKDIVWKKKHMKLNEEKLQFRGSTDIHGELLDLETPYQFFKYFFLEELINIIVYQSNLYCVQTQPNKPLVVTDCDIRQYIGILLYMSLVNMPNTRSYWSNELEFEPIKNTMSLKKFEKIRQFLHFNDNSQFIARNEVGHDRLFKIRPLIDHLTSKFNKIPLEEHLSVDEQMCSTKVRHYMKQYMPMKPHKWGFKSFVLSGISGFAYNFEIYSGQENDTTRPAEEPDLGATSNIVLRLSRIIPKNENYRLYHDNYYTAVPLMVHLAKEGIYSLGTIRRNRLPNCKLPTEAQMKHEDRGTSYEFVASIDGMDVSFLVWKDNKYVNLISSFARTHPETMVKRYDRKQKRTVDVKCPFVIQEYNRHMGGVDLLDSLMGRYKITMKSRKWYIRLFYHLLDLTLVNSWLAYKRVHQQKGTQDSKIVEQAKFRAEVAHCLTKINISVTQKRGRPSSSSVEQELQVKKKKGPTQHVPPQDVRQDKFGHWPIHVDTKI